MVSQDAPRPRTQPEFMGGAGAAFHTLYYDEPQFAVHGFSVQCAHGW